MVDKVCKTIQENQKKEIGKKNEKDTNKIYIEDCRDNGV